MAWLLGITSEIRSQDDCAPVMGDGLRCSCEVTPCIVLWSWWWMLYAKYLAWNTHLFDSRLTSCLVSKMSIDSTEYFRKHNFRNDHVVTKNTKIFYYENLELYGNPFLANFNLVVWLAMLRNVWDYIFISRYIAWYERCSFVSLLFIIEKDPYWHCIFYFSFMLLHSWLKGVNLYFS